VARIVVGGSNKGVGKTSLICGIIAALPEFRWTAIKITSHEYEVGEPSQPRSPMERTGEGELDKREPGRVWEEKEPGQGTDTARFLDAGAYRSLLVSVSDPAAPIGDIQGALAPGNNLIVESNSLVDQFRPDICLAVVSSKQPSMKLSFVPLVQVANALVTTSQDSSFSLPNPPSQLPIFRLCSLKQISPEMLEWLRASVGPSPP
jgi:hypothetical protein